MQPVCILGAGSWGTAQAILLASVGHKVILWGREEDGVPQIQASRQNQRYLPGVTIPDNVHITMDIQEAVQQASAVVLAVPAQTVRQVLENIAPLLPGDTIIINTAKGLEIATGQRMSQVASNVLGEEIMARYAVISGPSHAEEVALQVPTAVTAASDSLETAHRVQDLYMAPWFRVYTNPDVAGVELGGALKNIIAIAAGIIHGLGYGDNTQAALITRGLTEMTRLGLAMGGDFRTFAGLSGLGDLVVTCGSRHSRNRRAGEMIGQGMTVEQALDRVGMVVEGVYTCQIAYRLAQSLQVDMPITRACYRILYEKVDPGTEVSNLMKRGKKHEIEDIVQPGDVTYKV
ncbi:MAG TPA: NAD(P)H-dependent glycerol-3-phosphate dehydrogenase [Syntrophomonadaceae bacterium]|nr:NAD(P)H-dependent glycerol-3-phosphate dehydrogenase [Syntrophomonadaceae bacterium]HOQ09875.1 NAD(P)H-dependent glycerol-3-phosphate dehydrogenase [Syntrophomonadaceae bacterium]HPU48075.1 NAD(P)H-dependent glycerol-3-phosphate dehydrogenase [Syntrophomonadaceae bacterium]